MTSLILVFCLAGSPGTCQEHRPMLDDPSLLACIHYAQPLAAQWVVEHPKWRFSRYRCEIGKRSERDA